MLSEKEAHRVCAAALAHNTLQQITTVSKMLGRIYRPPEQHPNPSGSTVSFLSTLLAVQPVLDTAIFFTFARFRPQKNKGDHLPQDTLLAVLDVPVLDLHYGGVLALVEWPTIDRIFLAALLLLQDRRPMRPVFHRVQCH